MRAWWIASAIGTTLGVALTVSAAAARDLPVPADKGWRHAETGIALMAHVAGLTRTGLTDATQGEFDVAAQYEAPDQSVTATLYLFHPAVADVGLWFDRSRTALEARDIFRTAAPASADPIGFALPGAAAGSALRQTYASPGGPYRSTALAVIPVNGWMVAVRLSAKTLTAVALDATLDQFIAGIRWPRDMAAGSGARIVPSCATPLTFGKARRVETRPADMLMSLLAGSIAGKDASAKVAVRTESPLWCRDGEPKVDYGVYRDQRGGPGYTLALFDAGRTVSVFPSVMGQVEKTGTYSVTLTDVDGTTAALPTFSALPAPKQVWEALSHGEIRGRASGKTVTIDAKALK